MVTVVLYGVEQPGNLGAVARAMKNFGLTDLVLINPKCKIDEDARRRAVHAQEILQKAKIKTDKFLDSFDYLIGTSAKLGSDYNIPRSPLLPEQFAKLAAGKKSNIAVIFGPESSGLPNTIVERCDFIVFIPTSKSYGALNLSHAAAIVFYELFKQKYDLSENFRPASKKDKDVFLKQLRKVLDSMEFSTKEKKETQISVWKKVLGKSMLTRRELFALFGFLKKIK